MTLRCDRPFFDAGHEVNVMEQVINCRRFLCIPDMHGCIVSSEARMCFGALHVLRFLKRVTLLCLRLEFGAGSGEAQD